MTNSSRSSRARSAFFYLVLFATCLLIPQSAHAQLDREMRDLFRAFKDDLDPELKLKFEQAIRDNTDKIYFSEDQFKRFRDHPINPFDGLHELDQDVYRGGIELKFELPSLRNRMVGRNERQAYKMLSSLAPVASKVGASIVEVIVEGETVAIGTVVDSTGHIVTKASELGDESEVRVRASGRQTLTAKVVRRDKEFDLALLSTGATSLVPVGWSNAAPRVGEFVVSVGRDGKPIALGTYSHEARPMASSEQAILGVRPQNAERGIELIEITEGSAGDLAGLEAGDILLALDEKTICDVTELVTEIRKRRPGTAVELEILRGDQTQKIRATLEGRQLSAERAARFKMMNRLGAIPSSRSSDFPWVFQHDTPLFPEQCGGPVVDLNGNVVGLNIARQGRIASLAIPSDRVQVILAELLRDDIAQTQPESR